MRYTAGLLILIGLAVNTFASTFRLPDGKDRLIGEINFTVTKSGDTLVDVARSNDLGFDEILAANITVDAWLPPEGSLVRLPHYYLLPDAPHEGMVVNTAEMRLYYFPTPNKNRARRVETFPISIGRSDWSTPLITTKVIRKTANPIWYPPQSIREEHAQEGDPLPPVAKAGADNPLGLYALYLGIPSYLIHGTNVEFGIGMQVTHGCIRLYPEDIKHLYEQVKIGTSLRIVNQPYKVGWSDGVLYLEVHPELEATPEALRKDKNQLLSLIESALKDHPDYPIDWHAVQVLRIEANGLPEPIGPRTSPYTQAN